MTTLGTLGDVSPYVAIGRGLAERGHAPVIATSAFHREWIEDQGIAFRPVRPDIDPEEHRELIVRAMDPGRGPEVVIREFVLPSVRDSREDLQAAARDADLLITHPITFAGPIVAEESGVPWISSVLAPISFFSRHDPPVVPPLRWAKRLERIPGVPFLLIGLFRWMTRSWSEPVRALREERGLPPGGDPIYEGQHSPRGVLALFSRVLAEPRPDWPSNVALTGFPFHSPPLEDEAEADRLNAFLDTGPDPVVFTLGSSAVAAAGSFYEESLAAARRLGVRAVLLLGAPENRPDGPLGDDAIAVEYAPHDTLFPRATAVVHQGGIGTLGQALRAGRPMLVVPHSHDQPDNAHRAERLGVARTIRPGAYRADRVVAELRRLLEDPVYRRRAGEVGRAVRAEDGVANACDAIEAAV
ncbi:MAG: glycosyltransferase [Gemmatimonadota bacterium]|nr:glycosyltransferase [Gemmatimonadota bacterium]